MIVTETFMFSIPRVRYDAPFSNKLARLLVHDTLQLKFDGYLKTFDTVPEARKWFSDVP
jgi:hypothetical protein